MVSIAAIGTICFALGMAVVVVWAIILAGGNDRQGGER